MASFNLKRRDNGEWFSQIRVCLGRDAVTGKQNIQSKTWTAPASFSEKAASRDLAKAAGQFEAECKSGQFISKKERKEQARREYEEAERKPTFAKYAEHFIQEESATAPDTTIYNYQTALKRILPVLGGMKMEDIQPKDIRKYLVDLQTKSLNVTTGKPLSTSTVNQHRSVLHKIFADAKRDKIISSNPVSDVRKLKPRKDEIIKEPVYYNEEQVAYIIGCIAKEPPMWKAIMLFLVDSGCRRGEAAGLRWDCIDFTTGKVEICHNVEETPLHGKYDGNTKSGKSRTVILSAPVLEVLKEWQNQQKITYTWRGIKTNGYCFTSQDGTLLNANSISGRCHRFAKRYNLPGFHAHALRHSLASLFLKDNVDIVSVAQWLGHSTTSTTLKFYAHAYQEGQEKAKATKDKAIDYSALKQA